MEPRLSRIALALQKLILRTSRTPLARLWNLAYAVAARLAAALLTRGEIDPAIYLRGSLGTGDFQPGLSDIDLVVVVAGNASAPGAARERVSRRWRRLRRVSALLDMVINYPRIHEEGELADLDHASALTYGLDPPAQRSSGYFGPGANADRIRMLERPGLYDATAGWRLLSGPDRRPPEPGREPQLRRIAGWLELVQWWQWAVPACIDPSRPTSALTCVKLVAEPARIWLWLAHGERASSREHALERALRRLPEEEEALLHALALQRRLRYSPEPPLERVLPVLVRLSARIARLIGQQVEDAGGTEVRLAGTDPAELIRGHGPWRQIDSLPGGRAPRQLAFCDWRTLVLPNRPDRTFAPLPGDPGDPTVLAAAGLARQPGPQPALEADGIMILPAATRARTRLRAVQCRLTDPVSFALACGEPIARFPDVRGWSAEDTARRAVDEHRVQLEALPRSRRMPDGAGDAMALLFTATRAALFLEAIREGEPLLPLTVIETARRLAARSSAGRTIAEDALEAYRDFLGSRKALPPAVVSAMHEVVRDLPSYRETG